MKILVTQERIEQELIVGDYLDLKKADLEEVINIMAKFVTDDNAAYISPIEGLKQIRALRFKELTALANDFAVKVREGLIPPPKGEDTANPESQEPQPPLIG